MILLSFQMGSFQSKSKKEIPFILFWNTISFVFEQSLAILMVSFIKNLFNASAHRFKAIGNLL